MGNTPKKLIMYEQDQKTLIAPYGFIDTLLTFLNNNDIKYEIDDKTQHRPITMVKKADLSLYDYQQEAVDKMLLRNNGILISPTGSGKTRMAMALIGKKGVKTLWLTHTLDLLRQSKKVFKEFYSNKVGEISGGKVNIQDVTFATVQTLSKVDLSLYENTFDMVIVDESHKAIGSPTRVMQFYKVLSTLNAKYKYGLTATLYDKKNDISTSPIFLLGERIFEISKDEIPSIKATHEMYPLQTNISNDYLLPDKTIDYNKQLEYLYSNDSRNYQIVSNLITNKDNYNLILTSRNEHIERLSELLSTFDISSEVLIGTTKKADRERIISDFNKGKINVLFSNYQLASTGLDLPIANRLHMVLPIRDKRTVIQSAGRVERLHKLKKDAIVYDYVDVNIGNLLNMYQDRRRSLNAR